MTRTTERAILDQKHQGAAEQRVKHGMTVISDDTTEYDTQSNGLAEVVVREVEVWRDRSESRAL